MLAEILPDTSVQIMPLDEGEGNIDNRSKPKGVLFTQKRFILPSSELTTGSGFDRSCLRYFVIGAQDFLAQSARGI